MKTLIISDDLNMQQLISPNISVYNHILDRLLGTKEVEEGTLYTNILLLDNQYINTVYQLPPHRLPELFSLIGYFGYQGLTSPTISQMFIYLYYDLVDGMQKISIDQSIANLKTSSL